MISWFGSLRRSISKSNEMLLHIVQGSHKFDVDVAKQLEQTQTELEQISQSAASSSACRDPKECTLAQLKQYIQVETNLVPSDMRLLHRGRTLHGDEKTLKELNIRNGEKIMVLGRKQTTTTTSDQPQVPETEQKLNQFDSLTMSKMEKSVRELRADLTEMEKGFLNNEQQAEQQKKLNKRRQLINEECMRALEFLDSIQFGQEKDEALIDRYRLRRKTFVKQIQALQTDLDDFSDELQLLVDSPSTKRAK